MPSITNITRTSSDGTRQSIIIDSRGFKRQPLANLSNKQRAINTRTGQHSLAEFGFSSPRSQQPKISKVKRKPKKTRDENQPD